MTNEERRAIEADVARLVQQYVWANDAQDWQQCATLYTEDAVFRRPSGGDALAGRDAILASFTARSPRAQRHLMANTLVDVESDTVATAKSVIVLYVGDAVEHGLPVQDPKSPLIGTYEDRCVLTEDGWRFAERKGALDFRP